MGFLASDTKNKATPHNSARKLSERFCASSKFQKWGNTVCISRFWNCRNGTKDPLRSADAIVRCCHNITFPEWEQPDSGQNELDSHCQRIFPIPSIRLYYRVSAVRRPGSFHRAGTFRWVRVRSPIPQRRAPKWVPFFVVRATGLEPARCRSGT